MTSQGSAYGRFRKSLDRGKVNFALEAAAELETVSLADALELCELLAVAGDSRYEAAARRWLGRFLEEKGASLNEALIAGAALAELGERPNSPLARDTLEQLLEPPCREILRGRCRRRTSRPSSTRRRPSTVATWIPGPSLDGRHRPPGDRGCTR